MERCCQDIKESSEFETRVCGRLPPITQRILCGSNAAIGHLIPIKVDSPHRRGVSEMPEGPSPTLDRSSSLHAMRSDDMHPPEPHSLSIRVYCSCRSGDRGHGSGPKTAGTKWWRDPGQTRDMAGLADELCADAPMVAPPPPYELRRDTS